MYIVGEKRKGIEMNVYEVTVRNGRVGDGYYVQSRIVNAPNAPAAIRFVDEMSDAEGFMTKAIEARKLYVGFSSHWPVRVENEK